VSPEQLLLGALFMIAVLAANFASHRITNRLNEFTQRIGRDDARTAKLSPTDRVCHIAADSGDSDRNKLQNALLWGMLYFFAPLLASSWVVLTDTVQNNRIAFGVIAAISLTLCLNGCRHVFRQLVRESHRAKVRALLAAERERYEGESTNPSSPW
jgi:hypothetical protein